MACPVAQSSHIPTILAFYCRCNTLPPTQCLKTTHRYSFTVLEVVRAKLLQSCLILSQPGIESESPALDGGFFTTMLLGKPPRGQKSKVSHTGLKSRCWQGWAPSRGPKAKSVFLSFVNSRGHLYSLACWLFLHLQKQHQRVFKPFSDSPDSFNLLSGPCWLSCIHQLIGDNHPLSRSLI